MPLIPGINEQDVKAAPANTPYFKVQATADQFGDNIGKSMLAVGKSLGEASDAVGVYAKNHELDIKHLVPLPRPNTNQVIDDVNTGDAGVQDIQTSYLGRTGRDAVLAQPDALRDIDRLQARIVAGAPTPEAQRVTQAAIGAWATAAKNTIQRHALAQQRVYEDDVDNQQVALGRNAVGLLYNDTPTFLTRLHVAATTRADQAIRQVIAQKPDASPQELAAAIGSARQQTASNFVRARIEGALDQQDVPSAQALYQRWGADLLPGDQAAVGAQMQTARFLSAANQETSRILQQSAPEQPNER
jgi:hypothetical protein